MVMQEELGREPERETLILGKVTIKLAGSTRDPDSEFRVSQYLGLISEALHEKSKDISFKSDSEIISINGRYLELVSIEDGSIIARFKIIGTYSIVLYSAVAAYPSFKEAVPILLKDMERAIKHVIPLVPQHPENKQRPIKFHVHFRKDEDIAEQIQKNKKIRKY